MADIIMPKMGDAMEEGRIVQWLKKVGDTVAPGDEVAEIETDKSNVAIEAETAGTIQNIAFQAGDVAPVGAVIAVIGQGAPAMASLPTVEAAPPARSNGSAPVSSSNGTTPPPDAEIVREADAAVISGAASPSTSGSEVASGAGSAPPAPPRPAPQPVFSTAPAAASTPFKPYDSFVGALPENLGGSASVVGEPLAGSATEVTPTNERVKASPLARSMAASHRLDLSVVKASGARGEITAADVEAALQSSPAPAAAAPPVAAPAAAAAPAPVAVKVAEGDEVQEYNAMRRTIAKRLAESKATIPHFYVTSEIDVEAMLALREQVNAAAESGARKITLNDFLVKAVAVSLNRHPFVNSAFSDNKRILRKAVNIGVAVSIDDGLIVPVVQNAGAKSLRAIAAETHPLIEKARTGKLKPEEYSGGTFTISNLGQYDVENFAAIINPGEAAILAVSSIRPVAAVIDGQVAPRKRMKVTLCADHRVLDGVGGAEFLQTLKRTIENPLQILV